MDRRGGRTARARVRAVVLMVVAFALTAPAAAHAVPRPWEDPFYAYTGDTPLADIEPGTVIKSRTVNYHLAGLKTPRKVTQLLYRSTGQLGEPTVNATTIVKPRRSRGGPKLLSYQSFYDSLSPRDQPSHSLAGGKSLGAAIPAIETVLLLPFLEQGYTVTISDTQGQDANFAAGPEYGMNTLDAIRATFSWPGSGVNSSTKVGLIGYSGGAIATEWAAELAPTYAPDVDDNLVGAAMGGVLVHPAHNLHYIDGSKIWAGVLPMAVIGIARSFDIDLVPYLSERGEQLYERLKDASIVDVLGRYPGLTWAQMAKPEYGVPEDVPIYVETVNKIIMSTGGTPTIPLFIGQGAKGELEGTKGSGPVGKGDGVMVAGDVRGLAHEYCDRGVNVEYRQYESQSHFTTMLVWAPSAVRWLRARFHSKPAVDNCGTYPPGNSLAPVELNG